MQATTKPPTGDEERRREQMRGNEAVIALIREWEQEDPEEQRETFEVLRRTLNEDRLSDRDRIV